MGTIPVAPTFTAGEKLTSAKMNLMSAVQAFWSSPPRCSAYAATATSVANSGTTPTVIALDAELYDVANNYNGGSDAAAHDNVTNNSRVYIRTTGKYEISGQVAFSNNATGIRSAYVYSNAAGNPASGTQLFATTQGAVSGGFNTGLPIPTFEVPLVAGDYIELFGLQTSGGPLNTSTGQGATFLRVKLAAA